MTTPTPNDQAAAAAAAAAAGGTGGTPPAGTQGTPSGQGGSGDPNAPAISQAHMNHLLAEQKREIRAQFADYDDKSTKAERYDALVASTQTSEEQAADLTARLATRDRDVTDRDATIQRYRLAGQADLPADLWDMVGGTDESSMKANIEKLKRHMGTPAAETPPADSQQHQQPRRPAPTPGQGTPSPNSDGKTGGTMAAGRDLYDSRNKKSGVKQKADA